MTEPDLHVTDKRLFFRGHRIDLPKPVLDAAVMDDRIIVVFDYMEYPPDTPAKNLVAIDMAGNQLWEVSDNPIDVPAAGYTNITNIDPLTVGNFAGCSCVIDSSTGELLKSQFTK